MNRKQLLKNTTDKIKDINVLKAKIINHNKSNRNLLITITVLLTLAIIFVWERVEIDALSLNINKLKEKKLNYFTYNEILKAEIDNKSRFESINKIARFKLNMKFPGDNSVILVINNTEPKTQIKKIKELIEKVKIWEKK